jgi:Trk-type K+ transport system membrane component
MYSSRSLLHISLMLTSLPALPSGQRALAGLFQSFGVRASGFSIVSLPTLAPACRFLYIIMMYISAYPIAMVVRGTNVYEERSLGVYADRAEQAAAPEPAEGEVFSKYLGWHVRQQLAFDIWWLALALLLIDIIEVRRGWVASDRSMTPSTQRGGLTDDANFGWFNQFTILFEVVSAYAGVGLSLGIPTQNYAFSGALKTGSKLIIILVMLRGRHRDLPMSIDRASGLYYLC